MPGYGARKRLSIHQALAPGVDRSLGAVGEKPLGAALARFVREKGFQSAPYTTAPELLASLRAVAAKALRAGGKIIARSVARLTTGSRTVTVECDREPDEAVVDPLHLFIDRSLDDNAVKVTR